MKPALPRAASLGAAAMAVTLGLGVLAAPSPALAASPGTIQLGTAATFAVLAGAKAVRSTGPTSITGDVGISPWPTVAGFPPATVSGEIHYNDAIAVAAKVALAAAYDDAAGRVMTTPQTALGGLTLAPGVYAAGSGPLSLNGILTLDGQNDPNAVWIFQASADLSTTDSSRVRLVNNAQACNVFWQVAGSATLGAGSTIVGSILASASITFGSGVALAGRALARDGAVTLVDDVITGPGCSPVGGGTSAASPGGLIAAGPGFGAATTPVTTDHSTSSATPLALAVIVLFVLVAAQLGEAPDRRRRSTADPRWLAPTGGR